MLRSAELQEEELAKMVPVFARVVLMSQTVPHALVTALVGVAVGANANPEIRHGAMCILVTIAQAVLNVIPVVKVLFVLLHQPPAHILLSLNVTTHVQVHVKDQDLVGTVVHLLHQVHNVII